MIRLIRTLLGDHQAMMQMMMDMLADRMPAQPAAR